MHPATPRSKRLWLSVDGLGMLASGLCLVHCLALPALAVAMPGLGHAFEHEHEHTGSFPVAHVVFLLAAVPVGLVGLVRGRARHGRSAILVLGLLGLGLLAMGVVFDANWLGMLLSITGGLVLAAAHLWNFRSAPCCEHAHKATAPIHVAA